MRIPFRPLLGRIKRAIIPPHQVPAALEDRLLFRFGYLFYAAAEPPKPDPLWMRLSRSWSTRTVGEFVLVSHPETPVAVVGDSDRFTVLIGEAFFTKSAGVSPLDVIAAASGEPLLDTLDRLSGRFAWIVKREGRTSVYHDAFGARSVFYRREGAMALASHPEIFTHTFGDRHWSEMMDLVVSEWFGGMRRSYLPTDATIFEGVYALLPNHRYDIGRRRAERFWPRRPRLANKSFDDFFSTFDDYFRSLAGHLAGRQTILSITGGIDSRTLIAALKHYGLSFKTATWTTLNFMEWEWEPVRQVAEYLNGDHGWVDQDNGRISDTAIIGARNSGNYRGPSSAVAGMGRLYGGLPKAIWLTGIGSEMIRGAPPQPGEEIEEASAEALVRHYFRGPRQPQSEHVAFVTRETEAMLQRGDFEHSIRLGYDPGGVVHWELMAGTWGVCSINAMQTAIDSMFGFNTRAVAEVAMGLPDDVRRTKKLFHDVIRRYDPELATIHYQ